MNDSDHNSTISSNNNLISREPLANEGSINIYTKIISIFFSLIGLFFLCSLIKYFNYGFDFTDEAVYLFLMQRPMEYTNYHILTGFLYHPLYLLTKGNIFLLRLINFLLIILIAFNLCRLLLKRIIPENETFNRLFFYLTTFQLSLCSATILLIWLPTPNYNLLNYMAIMVTASGVLTLSQKKFFTNTRLICGWLVIALGGYLSFMSRPYTAVFLGILVILWASFSKKFSPKGVLLSFFAFLTLIFLTALITDGSIYGLFTRFFEAMKLEEISGAHKRFMIIAFNVGFFLNYFTLNFALLTVLIALYSLAIVLFDNKFYLTLPLFLCSPLFLIILISNYQYLLCYNCLSGYLIWIPVIIFIFYFLVKNRAKIIKPNLPLSIFFILLTVAYGLGSNNSFFITTSISAYFTLLASIIFFSSTIDSSDFPNKIIKLSALCLAITIGIIITSLGHPFRQQSILWFYSNKAPIRQGDSPLILSSNIATYLNNLHTFAERSGLKDNTPMLDLSGRNPGTIYALKGYTPKTPWIYTGYPGVNKYVFFSINKMTCEEVADMWLIYEVRLDSAPLRPEPINPNILSYFGAIFPNDYIKSETLVKHINFTNYSYLTTYQSFFKPARSKELAISKCIASKAKIGL